MITTCNCHCDCPGPPDFNTSVKNKRGLCSFCCELDGHHPIMPVHDSRSDKEQYKDAKRGHFYNFDAPENIVRAIYTDGGVIGKNPSNVGGTWAWCGVNSLGYRIMGDFGVVEAPDNRPITNNHTEQIALVKALEAMGQMWSGIVYSDSMIALGRAFYGWSTSNLPSNIYHRSNIAVGSCGRIRTVLLQGHPTKRDLIIGIGAKRGFPVSYHNMWCDHFCGIAGFTRLSYEEYSETNMITPRVSTEAARNTVISTSFEENVLAPVELLPTPIEMILNGNIIPVNNMSNRESKSLLPDSLTEYSSGTLDELLHIPKKRKFKLEE